MVAAATRHRPAPHTGTAAISVSRSDVGRFAFYEQYTGQRIADGLIDVLLEGMDALETRNAARLAAKPNRPTRSASPTASRC